MERPLVCSLRLEPRQSERSEPGKTAENRLERGGRAQGPGQLLGPAIGRTRREGAVHFVAAFFAIIAATAHGSTLLLLLNGGRK